MSVRLNLFFSFSLYLVFCQIYISHNYIIYVILSWSTVDMVSFRCIVWWFHNYIHNEMLTMISVVTLCHHTKLLQYYCLFAVTYITSLWPIYFMTTDLYLLIPFASFTRPAPSWPSLCNHIFVSCIDESLCFGLLFAKFHTERKSCGISFSVSFQFASYPLAPSMLWKMARFLSFFCGWVIFCCVCMSPIFIFH